MYRAKAGHVVRVLGADTALARVTAREIDRFVDVLLPSLSFRRNLNSPRATKSRAGCSRVG
jgi:hypothetical protein